MPYLISSFDENFYLTYPHCNGFADEGRTLILGKNSTEKSSLWRFEPGGERSQLCSFNLQNQPEKLLWPDVARSSPLFCTIADNKLWLGDLNRPEMMDVVYAPDNGKWLHPMPGIRADGKQIICGLHSSDSFAALLIDVERQEHRILCEKPWMVNHFHFCPFDPAWIGFSHEGNCAKVMDRVWGWHPTDAPEGKCYFNQMAEEPDRILFAGHERWSFHDRSVLIVAYGEGPGRPRGIYEAFVDGRRQRLVSEGDRDMHLDVSRDGRWVAIDTSGPHDLPGKGWENTNGISDILVADRVSGERRYVARSRIMNHPSHPHPVFNPDGCQLYFNEASEDGKRNRIWCADNPFLA